MRNHVILFTIMIFTVILFVPVQQVHASHNSNLFVSAESTTFDNKFAGAMVIEVTINDSSIQATDSVQTEPTVTVGGNALRMAQAADGNWYGYFADADFARAADATVATNGRGLDFGVFCKSDTASGVLGTSFPATIAVAVPRQASLSGYTNGNSAFTTCTGSMNSFTVTNHVIREPKSINTDGAVTVGQIGLSEHAWPIVQLYDFTAGSTVPIVYDIATDQTTTLTYIDNADSLVTGSFVKGTDDTTLSNAELIIKDMRLNQDPTDEDSWTFNVNSTQKTFYQAFDENGDNDANGTPVLGDLSSSLSSLGFGNSGKLSADLGPVLLLQTNNYQKSSFVSDAITSYSQIITLTESSATSGQFQTLDPSDASNIGRVLDPPKNSRGTVTYNGVTYEILSDVFLSSGGDTTAPTIGKSATGRQVVDSGFSYQSNLGGFTELDAQQGHTPMESLPVAVGGMPDAPPGEMRDDTREKLEQDGLGDVVNTFDSISDVIGELGNFFNRPIQDGQPNEVTEEQRKLSGMLDNLKTGLDESRVNPESHSNPEKATQINNLLDRIAQKIAEIQAGF